MKTKPSQTVTSRDIETAMTRRVKRNPLGIRRPINQAPKLGLAIYAFERAASRIASGREDFACCALDDEGGNLEVNYFNAVLNPDPTNDGPWYTDEKWHNIPWVQIPAEVQTRNRMARTLGLLLCAELAREGFVPDGYELP